MSGNLDKEPIFNMDETPTYIDMVSSTTLDFVGSENVDADTTGANKCRFTVVLCSIYAGEFIKTMVILKGLKKVPKILVPKGIVLRVSDGGSTKESILLDWMNTVFSSRGKFPIDREISPAS